MYILEYTITQILLIFWLIYLVKNYPKKGQSNSYNVFFGSIGAIILMTIVAIWFVVNGQSFIGSLWGSITR